MNLGPTELIIVLVIVLVLFGGAKLPKLAKSLGEAQREFKKGTDEGEKAKDEPAAAAPVTPVAPVVVTPPAVVEVPVESDKPAGPTA